MICRVRSGLPKETKTWFRTTSFNTANPLARSRSATVRQIIGAEIGRGEGANFVLKRSYYATIEEYSVRHALSIFRRNRNVGGYAITWAHRTPREPGRFVGDRLPYSLPYSSSRIPAWIVVRESPVAWATKDMPP
jgi:hypothetical protein